MFIGVRSLVAEEEFEISVWPSGHRFSHSHA